MLESFDGLGAGFQGPQGTSNFRNPSDNSLAVGPDHIVQTVNSRIAVYSKKGRKYDKTGTVLRAAYARTMETPFNENLLLASSSGIASTIGAQAAPVLPGFRNQFNGGLQQAITKYMRLEVDSRLSIREPFK